MKFKLLMVTLRIDAFMRVKKINIEMKKIGLILDDPASLLQDHPDFCFLLKDTSTKPVQKSPNSTCLFNLTK